MLKDISKLKLVFMNETFYMYTWSKFDEPDFKNTFVLQHEELLANKIVGLSKLIRTNIILQKSLNSDFRAMHK